MSLHCASFWHDSFWCCELIMVFHWRIMRGFDGRIEMLCSVVHCRHTNQCVCQLGCPCFFRLGANWEGRDAQRHPMCTLDFHMPITSSHQYYEASHFAASFAVMYYYYTCHCLVHCALCHDKGCRVGQSWAVLSLFSREGQQKKNMKCWRVLPWFLGTFSCTFLAMSISPN